MEASWQRTLLEKRTHSRWKKLKRSLENTSVSLFPSPPGQPFLWEEESSRPCCARPRDCLGVRNMKYVSKLTLCDPRFNWVHVGGVQKIMGDFVNPYRSIRSQAQLSVRAELISSLLLPVIYLACSCLWWCMIPQVTVHDEGYSSVPYSKNREVTSAATIGGWHLDIQTLINPPFRGEQAPLKSNSITAINLQISDFKPRKASDLRYLIIAIRLSQYQTAIDIAQ